ncbi:hypothetical protein CNMCM5793_003314 [Aspergillus hiratsukae]|uniref:Uncharacterized protein n=1 Tax=Aspergillus hiratsukae TaxID=1194566 RepID=A0A8H6UZF1_9EURO|nr:hypothetical protein CNMCM5793_003314 [Aspergillus hiratsukae]KAF7169829.1 hypothetical protein CNMCM6106_004732 [Aspergillus hiratsukae]
MAVYDTENLEEVTQFREALDAAPAWLLNKILRDVCIRVPAARPLVSHSLLVTEDQVAIKGDDSDSDSESDTHSESDADNGSESETSKHKREPANGILEVIEPKVPAPVERKRLRRRYALCFNCEEEYDVTLNDEVSCLYHPELPEPDEDAWADHDEYVHGDINTKEMREEYPDGFYYPCCDREYGEEGCEVDWHEEDTSGRKRRKY